MKIFWAIKLLVKIKKKIEKIRRLSSYYKFFHYGIEFPDIQEDLIL
ncbi:conserved hypothetical protein (plasmid) [Borreliella valaisiana VS116]|uniref:Uncharacterized protein n=1 Tax=Borreliella valaisiana VS116 TaxID=445987 RepID=C0R986_BORVA|nr:conserved hypothetical protein [Borreliella valaisiana VS116]